jgi:hypothetical protein
VDLNELVGQVMAVLIELRTTEVAGLDLSLLDQYRWHPHIEAIQLSRFKTHSPVVPCLTVQFYLTFYIYKDLVFPFVLGGKVTLAGEFVALTRFVTKCFGHSAGWKFFIYHGDLNCK